jgi:hypothetical protein
MAPFRRAHPHAENDGEAMVRRFQSIEANARQEVSGPVVRPGSPAVRFVPLGTVLELPYRDAKKWYPFSVEEPAELGDLPDIDDEPPLGNAAR